MEEAQPETRTGPAEAVCWRASEQQRLAETNLQLGSRKGEIKESNYWKIEQIVFTVHCSSGTECSSFEFSPFEFSSFEFSSSLVLLSRSKRDTDTHTDTQTDGL